MPRSIERQTEDRILSLLSSTVTGLNYYNGDRWGDKSYYGVTGSVVVAATELGKELTPGSGVFQVGVSIGFGAKIHDQNPVSLGYVWENIRQQFYYDTSLESRLSTTGFTVYGVTKEGEGTEVNDDIEIWEKKMMLKLWVTPL